MTFFIPYVFNSFYDIERGAPKSAYYTGNAPPPIIFITPATSAEKLIRRSW